MSSMQTAKDYLRKYEKYYSKNPITKGLVLSRGLKHNNLKAAEVAQLTIQGHHERMVGFQFKPKLKYLDLNFFSLKSSSQKVFYISKKSLYERH